MQIRAKMLVITAPFLLAQLEQERMQTQANSALLVKAPVSGVVATQIVKPGAVQAGQPLLSLLPGDGKLEAELLVPSRAIGFIAPAIPCCCATRRFRTRNLATRRGGWRASAAAH